MSISVLTSVTHADWEVRFLAHLDRADSEMSVARRCLDAADLIATADIQSAPCVAIVSENTGWLNAAVIAQLWAAGVYTVGLCEPNDEMAEKRLLQCGVHRTLSTRAPLESVVLAIKYVVSESQDPFSFEEPVSGAVVGSSVVPHPDDSGKVIAVWGPYGAPGRSTVALGLGDELSRLAVPAMVIDADTYGASIAPMLGLLDEAPGLAAAARMHNAGTLDVSAFAGVARSLNPYLRVITGLSRTNRWHEVRAESMQAILVLSRHLASFTIVDCSFSVEEDEELSQDVAIFRRNVATLETLRVADTVIVVGSPDPVGMQRAVRAWIDLAELFPHQTANARVVINKLRQSLFHSYDPQGEVVATLRRFIGIADVDVLPYDRDSVDRSIACGQTLAEVAPHSLLRRALMRLAGSVHSNAA